MMPTRPLPRVTASSEQLRAREALLEFSDILEPSCRQLRVGDVIFHAGDRCAAIHVLDAGLVRLSAGDGVATGFRFRGDWLGVESLAAGRHDTSAEAMDACVVWSLRTESLAAAGLLEPAMVRALVGAVDVRDRPSGRASGAGAEPERRLAQFLLSWADALVREGRSESRVGLRVTRADLVAYLGMAQGTVEHALSILCAARAVDCDRGRRHEVCLDDRVRLRAYAAQACSA